MITINELFSGIGAFRKAFIRLGIPHEVIGISEIDKYAVTSYEALYGKTRNYGDISKVERLDYADLWTYGFPCQDISVAGQGKGIVKGQTRSGLLYEVERLLIEADHTGTLPKYLILENVKNLVVRYKDDFDAWLEFLDGLGYVTYWQVLNAADYGIPQSRQRVFAVSIRKDLNQTFTFPAKIPLEKRLIDMLDEQVDEKYYINQELTDKLVEQLEQKTISNTVRVGGERLERHKAHLGFSDAIINPAPDDTCRTIKAQYGNTSISNMRRTGTFGTSGVVTYLNNGGGKH